MNQGSVTTAQTQVHSSSSHSESTNAAPGAMEEPRRRNKLCTVCIFILVVEMCERLCYYTLAGSMRNFLEDAGPSGVKASAAVSISACFSMLSYLTCILGGYVADNRLGRYRTILYFALLYIFGVVVVAISAYPAIMSTNLSTPLFLLGSLVFVAIGTGAIKPNVMNFGADQYDATNAVELDQQKAFFSYFYLTINIGCVGAFGFCVNLATSDASKGDPGSGYFKSYVIAAVGMTIALLAFVAGTPKYAGKGGVTHTPMISVIRSHLVDAAKSSAKGKVALLGWCLIPIYMMLVLAGSLLASFPEVSSMLTWVSMGLAVLSCVLLIVTHMSNDFIRELPGRDLLGAGAISIEEVKGALACIPTILCINVGFNIPYNAMNNAYPAQACQMDTRLFGGTQLNGAFFTLGDALAIILLVPFFETVVYPAATRLREGRPVTRWAKYTMGFILAILANASAVVIEHVRRGLSEGANPQFVICPEHLLHAVGECSACPMTEPGCTQYLLSKCSPNASLPMTSMSAFWTFVPMFLTGAGEILVNPVVYQYVFEHAPCRLRSIVQAMNLVAAGSISNAITASLGPLIPEDFNTGQLVYYFYANIAFAILLLLAYWLIAALGPAPQPAVSAPHFPVPELAANSSLSVSRSSFRRSAAEGSVAASFMCSVDRGASVVSTPNDRADLLLQRPRRSSQGLYDSDARSGISRHLASSEVAPALAQSSNLLPQS